MALIKCKYCGKEISDISKVCIHCNTKLKETNIFQYNNLVSRYIPNIIFTIIFIVLLTSINSFSYRSYLYSFTELLEYKLLDYEIYNIFNSLMYIYLVINIFLYGFNKTTNIISKIMYTIIPILEILFLLVIKFATTYHAKTMFYIIIIYTTIWIIYLYTFNKQKDMPKKKLSDLEEAKNLLDKNIITLDEFNKIKDKILGKYLN